MFKLFTGFTGFTVAVSVIAIYASGVLGTPDWFIALLASAAALLFAALAWSAREAVTSRVFTIAGVVCAVALVVFGFGVTSSLVVNGKVVSHNSEPARVARQVAQLREDTGLLRDAVVLLTATPAEQFARAGEAAKMSDRCAAMLKKWDRIAPATSTLIPSIVAMKEGSSSCVQGTKVSSQSSATPDDATRQAIADARAGIESALGIVDSNTSEVLAAQNLTGVAQ